MQPNHLLRLPPELLVDILMKARNYDQHIPWSFQHVNRDLRHIVTTIPLLWNIVDIGYGPTRALLHLDRSGQTPLLVSCSGFDPECEVETIDQFIALLLPHGERIHHLYMVFLYKDQFEASIPLLASTSSQLATLEAGIKDPSMEGHDHLFESTVTCQPRHLFIHGCTTRLVNTRLLSKVTSFEYRPAANTEHYPTVNSMTLWLGRMAELEKLVLGHFLIRLEAGGSVLLTLPKVREVTLEDMEWESVDAFWSQVRTPALEAFTVIFRPHGDPPGRSVIASAALINPHLQRLDLKNYYTTGSRWDEVFHNLPHLTDLRLAPCSLDERSLSALSGDPRFMGEPGVTSGAPHACPKLKKLIFVDPWLTSRMVRDLVVLRSRSKLGNQINSVMMHEMHPNEVDDADIEEIMQVVDEFKLEFIEGTETVLQDSDSEGLE